MTTEEKLQHFKDFCVNDAKLQADKLIEEYKNTLQQSYEEHKNDAIRRQKLHIKIENDRLLKETNKTLSLSELKYRKLIGEEKAKIDEKIFTELENKLEEFMSTNEYYLLLDKQIKKALKFAGDKQLDIYMDPDDQVLTQRLSIENNIEIKISKYPFLGGTRAVIPEKNILIDNSFETKIKELRANFHLNIEGGNDE